MIIWSHSRLILSSVAMVISQLYAKRNCNLFSSFMISLLSLFSAPIWWCHLSHTNPFWISQLIISTVVLTKVIIKIRSLSTCVCAVNPHLCTSLADMGGFINFPWAYVTDLETTPGLLWVPGLGKDQ